RDAKPRCLFLPTAYASEFKSLFRESARALPQGAPKPASHLDHFWKSNSMVDAQAKSRRELYPAVASARERHAPSAGCQPRPDRGGRGLVARRSGGTPRRQMARDEPRLGKFDCGQSRRGTLDRFTYHQTRRDPRGRPGRGVKGESCEKG